MKNSYSAVPVEWLSGREAIAFLDSESPVRSSLPESVFTSVEWYLSAAETISNDRGILILVESPRECGRVLLGFSYGRESVYGIPLRTLRLLGYPFGDRHPLGIEDESSIGMMIGSALGDIPVPIDVVILDEIPVNDETALSTLAGRAGFKVRSRRSSRAPYFSLTDIDSPAQRTARYSRSLRERIRRANVKLRKHCDQVEVRVCFPTPGEIPGLIADISKVEKASWKGQHEVGIFTDAVSFAFFKSLVTRLAARRMVALALLYADEQLIAYRLAFVADNVFFDYNFAHSPDYSPYSPGRILLDELIGFAVEQGGRGIDGSRGHLSTPQLLSDWTKDEIVHSTLWLCPKSASGQVIFWLSTYGPKLRNCLRLPGQERK